MPIGDSGAAPDFPESGPHAPRAPVDGPPFEEPCHAAIRATRPNPDPQRQVGLGLGRLVPAAGLAGPGAVVPAPAATARTACETLKDGATLAGASTERVYVADVVISNIVDGRLRVFDARAGKLLGMINTGYAGNFALSAKADEVYVATTYLSRGGRGERTDILEVWDAQSLAFRHEVVLPPRRAQTLNYRGMVSVTANGRFVLVQNATPATSITVVECRASRAKWLARSPPLAAGARCPLPVTPRVLPCCAVTASWPP